MSKIHLAIASTTSRPGQLEYNLNQIVAFARRAGNDGAQLLLTPEMSATGYGSYPEVLALAEVAGDGPIYRALAQAARETNVVICAGFVEQGETQLHLSHYAIFPDGNFAVQRKNCIMPSEQPLAPNDEEPNFTVFEVGGVPCAIVICADSGIENIREKLAARGVRVLLQPTGAGGLREDRVTNQELQTRAGRENYARILETVFFPGQSSILACLELRQAMAAVNLCGYDGQCYYHLGHGMIVNALGEVPALFHGQPNLDLQKPMYAHAEIDLDNCICEPEA